jgi:cytochrome c oxidase assembly protein subunit 15
MLALLTAVATFPLIFMGGLVTSKHAGMSVPDWPNSYGYNMFLFPPRLWVGGIFFEHTHRLMGSFVGFLSVLLAIWAWRHELFRMPREAIPRRWIQYLCLAVLGGVILQGVLGGLRVVLVKLDLAIVHACVAQLFFCLSAFTALATSRWWIGAPPSTNVTRGFIRLAACCVLAVFLQLVVGAMMRHFDAGLAIPDLPLAYGKILPPLNAAELAAVNQQRAWTLNLDPVTLGQVWLCFAHRVGAVLVTTLLATLIIWTLHRQRGTHLAPLAVLLAVLLIVQIILGVVTVLFRKPADVASAHVACGALVLVTAWLMLMCALRLFDRRSMHRPKAAKASIPSFITAGAEIHG